MGKTDVGWDYDRIRENFEGDGDVYLNCDHFTNLCIRQNSSNCLIKYAPLIVYLLHLNTVVNRRRYDKNKVIT